VQLDAYTERSPQLVETPTSDSLLWDRVATGLKPTPGGLSAPLGWLAVYCLLATAVCTLAVNTE